MNKEELKTLVAQLLREMEPAQAPTVTAAPEQVLDDITKTDLRKEYLVPHAAKGAEFLELKAKTPARLGVGRAGARYKTQTLLRFRADHAAAQDSVFSDVSEEFVKKNNLIFVRTKCGSKDEYLTRPDLGRRFDEKAKEVIQKACGATPKLLLVIGDGLSSAAIEANAMDCAAAIRQGLLGADISLGETLFIQYCRVGASDHLGEITGAELVCMLVGERPGLVTSESMSAYITYMPRPGVAESARTVVSNIHRQGTPAVEAGAHIATLLQQILQRKCSGVAFRQGAQT